MTRRITSARDQVEMLLPWRKTSGIGPDEWHEDWRKSGRSAEGWSYQWHPPYGESHVRYTVHPKVVGTGWPPDKTSKYRWVVRHDGVYQGTQTFYDKSIGGGSIALPQYSHSYTNPLEGEFKSLFHAQGHAEEHFRQNYPKADYGDIDLSQIDTRPSPSPNRGMGDDEDYGHIFGMRHAKTAPSRRVSFTGDGDWKIDQWGNHECRLENGHVLYCTQIKSKPEVGWQWGIYDRNQEDPEKRARPVRQGGQRWGGFTADDPQDHLPTAEHAKRQAEEHYKAMYPLGTDTGGHDSGVDYSDLNKFLKEEL